MTPLLRIGLMFGILWSFLSPFRTFSQSAEDKAKLVGVPSVGDLVKNEDAAAALRMLALPVGSPEALPRPVHLLYMHGINAVGNNDSEGLRKGICQYIYKIKCHVTNLGRVYAGGPFSVAAHHPMLTFMGTLIWEDDEDWHASAPFIDRYEISSQGRAPILLDEMNWWPLAFPLKCKFLIRSDANLTGRAEQQIKLCSGAPTKEDPVTGKEHDKKFPDNFSKYRWIDPDAGAQTQDSGHAEIFNGGLKNGLMDWGFGDATMALGPMHEILTAAVRQMLVSALQPPATPITGAFPDDLGDQVVFVTHSLGSYLALAALDPEHLGPHHDELAGFSRTDEQKTAIDFFRVHTGGYYFLANQIALLELAGLYVVPTSQPLGTPEAQGTIIGSIQRLQATRLGGRQLAGSVPLTFKIVAWSDPNDLLSWRVPPELGPNVKNLIAHNKSIKLPPFLAGPIGTHDNYARNKGVIALITLATQ